jgi:exonuclease III
MASRRGSTISRSWLKESDPDIACLQEIKSVDEGFPRLELEALGYHVETHGQKGFNGVAILSKQSPDEVNRGLPGDDSDEQARFIEAVFSTDSGVARGLALSAQRQSGRHRKISLQAALDGTASTHSPKSAWRWKNLWCSPAITTSSPNRSIATIPRCGRAMRCFVPESRDSLPPA